MGLRVSGKNLDVGEALRGQVEARVASALGKYFDGDYSGHVTVAKDGAGFRTECVLHLTSGHHARSLGRGARTPMRASTRRPSASRSACGATSGG